MMVTDPSGTTLLQRTRGSTPPDRASPVDRSRPAGVYIASAIASIAAVGLLVVLALPQARFEQSFLFAALVICSSVATLYLTYRTYKVYTVRGDDGQEKPRDVMKSGHLHLATVEALARAIDAKDETAQTHIRRVQMYAACLARAMGLSELEIEGVKTAALLHDIGKIAVPEHILSKSGPLTPEEFQKLRIHPQVGAEIIAAVPFPFPVAPLILSHHERWDGAGYPRGLKGEEIPLGARILSAVDYYDAVTTERPYHKALSHDGAIGLMRHESG